MNTVLVRKPDYALFELRGDCQQVSDRYGLEIAATRQKVAFYDDAGGELWDIT